MSGMLFISYSRADMQHEDWLGRLRMYLAPFRRSGAVDVWDDGRIQSGNRWRNEIATALDSAAAAALLVGPGFLASDFVGDQEVPKLLHAAEQRGLRLFPLIIGFCAYEASDLAPYQAYNSPKQPLESLVRAEQNRVLNELAMAIDESLRAQQSTQFIERQPRNIYTSLLEMQKFLADSYIAFQAQCRRRDALVRAIERRLKFKNTLEYEQFFLKYHQHMVDAERFEFDQIRAITEGAIQTANRKMLAVLEKEPDMLHGVPVLTALRQHLVFWLNKYDRVFVNNPAMCLLYTGVEDGVPFPNDVDGALRDWLATHAGG
jgi:hypothetical protein